MKTFKALLGVMDDVVKLLGHLVRIILTFWYVGEYFAKWRVAGAAAIDQNFYLVMVLLIASWVGEKLLTTVMQNSAGLALMNPVTGYTPIDSKVAPISIPPPVTPALPIPKPPDYIPVQPEATQPKPTTDAELTRYSEADLPTIYRPPITDWFNYPVTNAPVIPAVPVAEVPPNVLQAYQKKDICKPLMMVEVTKQWLALFNAEELGKVTRLAPCGDKIRNLIASLQKQAAEAWITYADNLVRYELNKVFPE